MAAFAGFSLIEAMMAVAVMAILTTVTLPAYSDYQRRAYLPEAFNGLADFRVRMEHFYQDHQRYGSGVDSACAGDPSAAGWNAFAPRDAQNFSYRCAVQASQDGYLIVATGRPGSSAAGHVFTIDHEGRHGTVLFKGRTVDADCWLTSDGGC